MGVDPITMGLGLQAVSIGLGLFGTSRARSDAKQNQRQQIAFDARTARLESKAILEEAALEAIEIRREGELLGKKQTAYTAKAGLKLGRGTAKDIQEETKRLTEKDVATTLSAAERKSKQLLLTYDPESQRKEALTPLLESSKQEALTGLLPTALEGETTTAPNNFIMSKGKKVKGRITNNSLFTGL